MAHSVHDGVWGSVIGLWVGWWGLGVRRLCVGFQCVAKWQTALRY